MRNSTSNRRTIMRGVAAFTALTLVPSGANAGAKKPAKIGSSPVARVPLPFAEDALDPVISARTVGIHYGKHHKIYADKVADAIKGTPLASASLEEVILAASKNAKQVTLFNMAAQVWNHNFYWQSLTPKVQTPSGKLAAAIEGDFGSIDECKKALAAVCTGQFGSGWGWIVSDKGKLKAVSTSNADTPFLHGLVPLLTVDVWEHAYYLDYQNRRADHVAAVLDKTLNWEFAARNFENA